MKFSASTVVLGAALAATEVSALTMSHGHLHNHAARHAAVSADLAKKDLGLTNLVESFTSSMLSELGITTAANPTSGSLEGAIPWIGTDGYVTNEFINQGTEPLTLVCWGGEGYTISFVKTVQPQISVSLPANNGSVTVSFPKSLSGACSFLNSQYKLSEYGQIFNTWLEHTIADNGFTTFDVSREVNMNGINVSAVTQGGCTTNMDLCSFQCTGGATSCEYGYTLNSCDPSTNPGASSGTYGGAASGGCQGLPNGGTVKTYVGWSYH